MIKAKRLFVSVLALAGILMTSCGSMDFAEFMDSGLMDEKAIAIQKSVESIEEASKDISPEDEYYIGRTAAAIILKNNKVYKNQKKTKYVNNICAALTVNSEKPYIYNGYKVAILDTEDFNAISTPGGHIFISKGLYNLATSEDMLAAVIAHELAHIQLGHSSQSIKSSRVTKAIIQTANAVGDILSEEERSQREKDFNKAAAEYVENAVTKGFSKDQEFKADAYAMKLLLNAGYDPKAMLDLLNLLKEKQSGETTIDKTHPSPEKRIEKVQSEMNKLEYKFSTSNPQDRMARFKASR